MTDLDLRIQAIQAAKKNKESGKFNLIPWYYHFPRLSKKIPGLFRGEMAKILSPTGVGKTKLAKFLSLLLPFELHKKYGLKFHTIYFCLEESKEEFIDSLIIMILHEKYGISIDRLTLNSYFHNTVDESIIKKIIECKEIIDELLDHVDIIDTVFNPTGAYKYLRSFSEKVGKHHYKQIEIYDEKNKRTILQEVYSHYVQNDPEIFYIVVTDHISLFNAEGKLNHHQTLARWSADYCRKQITKNWNWTVLNVQQVAMNSDDVNAFKAGKLEPSISDAGNNKEIIRDDMLVMALFDPLKHELKKHNGYDITELKNKYRSFSILKNRYGEANLKIGLYFNGATGYFEELPDQNNHDELKKYYKL